jgi:hypothetical protein
MQGVFGNKPLFGVFDEAIQNTLKVLGTYVQQTKAFMEVVKVVFKQSGFVASGLSTSVRVAEKPVSFVVGA